jgi:hypothetical protein
MENQYRQSTATPRDEVHIYLRNSQKKAHLIGIQKEVNHNELRRIVS